MPKTLDARTKYLQAVRTAITTPNPGFDLLVAACPHVAPAALNEALLHEEDWEVPLPPVLVRGGFVIARYECSGGQARFTLGDFINESQLRAFVVQGGDFDAMDMVEFESALAFAQRHWGGRLIDDTWADAVMLAGIGVSGIQSDGLYEPMLQCAAVVGLDCNVGDALSPKDWYDAIQVAGAYPLEAIEITGSRSVNPWRGFCAKCMNGLDTIGCPKCKWRFAGEPGWGPLPVPVPEKVRAVMRAAGMQRTVSLPGGSTRVPVEEMGARVLAGFAYRNRYTMLTRRR